MLSSIAAYQNKGGWMNIFVIVLVSSSLAFIQGGNASWELNLFEIPSACPSSPLHKTEGGKKRKKETRAGMCMHITSCQGLGHTFGETLFWK